MSFNMALHMPNMFTALALIVPFFKHYENKIYKNEPIIKILDKVKPSTKFGSRAEVDKNSDYYKQFHFYYSDTKNVPFSTVRTLKLFIQEQRYAK